MARAVRQGLLRHFKLQNAVVVGRLHVVGVYAAQVKLTAVRAKGALAADVVVLVVLFFLLCLALGVNGQRVAVDIEMDVLLVMNDASALWSNQLPNGSLKKLRSNASISRNGL